MSNFDLNYRPDSYWPESLTPEQRLSCIRGKERQKIARLLYAQQGFGALNEFLVREGLADEERAAWGAVGPWCMGGEYLPDLYEGEVEIARISLASTTSDQISFRARPDGDAIRYRIVGEYEEDAGMRYELLRNTTERPLSLNELMTFLESASQGDFAYSGGVLTSLWAMMEEVYGDDEEEIVGFMSMSSAFYPGIEACYREMGRQWVADLEVCAEDE
jgi:hypothetical protein